MFLTNLSTLLLGCLSVPKYQSCQREGRGEGQLSTEGGSPAEVDGWRLPPIHRSSRAAAHPELGEKPKVVPVVHVVDVVVITAHCVIQNAKMEPKLEVATIS